MKKNRQQKICIIGAGPSGIVACDSLKKLGYKNVTLLEKDPDRVGGKCHTVIEGGTPLDLGAIYVFPHYPIVNQYVRETGCSLSEAAQVQFLEEDGKTRPFGKAKSRISLTSRIMENLGLAYQFLWKYNKALSVPLGEVNEQTLKELSIPTIDWIKKNNFQVFYEGVFPMMRTLGFGYDEQKISTIYNFQVPMLMAKNGKLRELADVSKIKLYHVKEGYGEMWQRVANSLDDVRLGVEISGIKRDVNCVSVETNQGNMEFDKLILACGFENALEFIDATPEEKKLAGSIEGFDVWVSYFRMKTESNMGILMEERQKFCHYGYGLGLLRYSTDSDWMYYFGYTKKGLGKEKLIEQIKSDVKTEFKGELLTEPRIKSWKGYFPRFSHQDVAKGYHAHLEDLQGQNNTYLTGALLGNNGVEWCAAHAQKLINKHFA